jgi:ketosteroid isomerase-like protein
MAGSRAASAREPGQIREEAALSVTARAPRISLAGADDRRARPGTGFEGGCTVRFAASTRLGRVRADAVPPAMTHVELIHKLAERWNAGDVEGVVELYTEDAVIVNGPDWPEQDTRQGREGLRTSIDEWQGVWESSEVEIGRVEAFGDTVVVEGAWITRGRSSGLSGRMPANIVCTIRDGKIASLEWFASYHSALAAARGD